MMDYFINAIAIFVTAWLSTKIPCCQNNRGELVIGKLPDTDDTLITKHKRKIGNITYIVTSVFSQKSKGDVIDKISRLIDRDISNITLEDAVNK